MPVRLLILCLVILSSLAHFAAAPIKAEYNALVGGRLHREDTWPPELHQPPPVDDPV